MTPFRSAPLLLTLSREDREEAAYWSGTLTVLAVTLSLLTCPVVRALLQPQDGFGWLPLGPLPGFSLGCLGLAAVCTAVAWQQGRKLRA